MNNNHIVISAGSPPHQVYMQGFWMGNDLTVLLYGGVYHAGAVAMASPRPSLDDPDKLSATASVLTSIGHKDDEPAREMALALATAFNTTVVVVAGIHLDDAEQDDIAQYKANVRTIIAECIRRCRPVHS